MKIALFGGSFDPPHLGHLHILQAYRKRYPEHRIFITPCYQNPLKKSPLLYSDKERLALCRVLFKSLPDVQLLRYELNKKKISYTIDTVNYLIQKYRPDYPLHIIAGDDILTDLGKWKSYDELKLKCLFIICPRTKSKPSKAPHLKYLTATKLALSATEIRKKILKRQPLKGHLSISQIKLLGKWQK
jgi:nicotinate-nucleotide adenylyltransferase